MNVFRKKLLINLGINAGIILILGGALFFIINDLRAVGESIETEETALAAQVRIMQNLSTLKQESERADIVMNKLRNALPTRELLFVFSEDITRLARDNNLSPSFTFGEETVSDEANVPSKIVFTITVTGAKQSVLSFLNALENSRYFTRITRLEMFAHGDNIAVYQATLSGEIFFSQ